MGWNQGIFRASCVVALFSTHLAFSGVAAAHSDDDDLKSVLRGQELALSKCAQCHEVGQEGKSVHPEAVPFRFIARLYPVEELAEAFAEGIYVGHPDMPTFELSVDDVSDLLNYLKAVQED